MNEITFAFTGITETSDASYPEIPPLVCAKVCMTIGRPDDVIDYLKMELSIPVSPGCESSLSKLREESLSLAREVIQTAPLLTWMEQQRKAHARPLPE